MALDKDILFKQAEQMLGKKLEAFEDVIAILDHDLTFLYVNDLACELLSKERHELEGHGMLKVFPALIASDSHRHILTALSGQILQDVPSTGNITRPGAKFHSDYYPMTENGKVIAVLGVTRKIYFP